LKVEGGLTKKGRKKINRAFEFTEGFRRRATNALRTPEEIGVLSGRCNRHGMLGEVQG
jgi:hypothetical protein